MKNLTIILNTLLIVTVFALPISAQNENREIEGNWLATLDVSGIKMRLVLKVVKTVDGYTAKLDSIDQGAKDLPIDTVTLAGDKMSFSAAQFGMSYEGTINEKGDEISGTFKQGARSTPFVFRRIAEIPKNTRRQDPTGPYPYSEDEVSYKNVKDNVKLAGTLSVPPGDGKFPAVVLISGSGSQDRDSTVFGHRPFLVLADYLTRRGIAVLRVDDRGIGGSDLGSLTPTTDNFVGDVLAGVEYLKTRSEINTKQIGLIGHSEGGIIAPIAAVRSNDVAFIVMLAGTGQTGENVVLTQLALLQKGSGAKPDAIAQTLDFQKSLFAIVKNEPVDKIAGQKIEEMLSDRRAKLDEPQRKDFARVETSVKEQMPLILSPWYRYFLAYDPRPTLEKVKIPVLALNGENDLQVSSKENLAIISTSLKAGGNKDFTVTSFPKLNHLFQTSQTGMPNEYGEIEETISPQILETISNWILGRTGIRRLEIL